MLTLYSKDYCSYCTLAKNLLDSLHIEYDEVDVSSKPEILSDLVKRSGMRTLPQIYTEDGYCLGGYNELIKLHTTGKLREAMAFPRSDSSS